MALYRADIKVTNTGSYFPVEIESGASYTAKEAIQHIYNPITIKNLRQVSSSSSSSDSDISFTGIGGMIGLAFLFWLFTTYTPIITMFVGGSVGTWLSQLIVGQTVEEYTEREDDSGHGKFLIVLATALILGGYGYFKGVEIQKFFNTPSSIPTEVKQK